MPSRSQDNERECVCVCLCVPGLDHLMPATHYFLAFLFRWVRSFALACQCPNVEASSRLFRSSSVPLPCVPVSVSVS